MIDARLGGCDLDRTDQPDRIDIGRVAAALTEPALETIATAPGGLTFLRTIGTRPYGRGDRGEPAIGPNANHHLLSVEFDIVEMSDERQGTVARLTVDIREREGKAMAHIYFHAPMGRAQRSDALLSIEAIDAIEHRLEQAGVAVCIVHSPDSGALEALEARGYWITALQDTQPGHDVLGSWAYGRTLGVPRPGTLFAAADQ